MKKVFYDIVREEGGAGAVEYGMLVGILGFAMFEIWSMIRFSLFLSYQNILRNIRNMKYP